MDAFKNSKRGTCIKNMPKFSTASVSDLATSMSFSPLVLAPTSLAFETASNQVTVGIIKSIGKDLIQFTMRHREDSNLLGNELLNDNLVKISLQK